MAMTCRDYGAYPVAGTKMWCPVCGSYFKATGDTRYIRHGMYVCGWKCFRDPSKEVIEEPKEDEVVAVSVKIATTSKVNRNKTIVADINSPKKASKGANIAPKPNVKSANNTPKDNTEGVTNSKAQKPTKKDEKNIKSTSTHTVVDLF
jgi:hypothetical protein